MSSKGATPQITLRVRPGLLGLWREAAELQNLSLSAWLKDLATRAAVQILQEADEQSGSRPVRKRVAKDDIEEVERDVPGVVAIRRK